MAFFASGIKKSNTPSGVRTPTGIDDVFAWFDASDGVDHDANAVHRWKSKVNGYYVSQSINGSQPTFVPSAINGKDSMTFAVGDNLVQDSAGNALATMATGSTETTICCVVKSTAAAGNDYILSWGEKGNSSVNTAVYNASSDNGLAIRVDATATDAVKFVGHDNIRNDGEFHIVTFTFGPALTEWVIRVDGKIQMSATITPLVQDGNIDIFAIGDNVQNGAADWVGDIAELMIYDRALSDTEIETVEEYLFDKYFNPDNFGSTVAYFKASDIGAIDLEQT